MRRVRRRGTGQSILTGGTDGKGPGLPSEESGLGTTLAAPRAARILARDLVVLPGAPLGVYSLTVLPGVRIASHSYLTGP